MSVKLRSELGTTRNFAHVLDTMLPTPVAITDAATVSLTKSSHQGRVLLVPDPSAEMTITIPAPAAAGEYYKFVYAGAAEDDHNIIIQTGTDNSAYIQGGLALIDTDGNSSADYADGNSNEKLTLTDPGMFEINFLSTSATVWQVWGWAVSADTAAFAD